MTAAKKKFISTLEMECAIAQRFEPRRNLIVPNVSWGLSIHECDMLVLSQANYATEVEIKISKADLKKDAEKWHGHNDYYNRIKSLFFAFPEHLWPKLQDCLDCIPERAGVLLVSRQPSTRRFGPLWRIDTEREPEINRQARKFTDDERYKLARLGALRIWRLKNRELKRCAD